MTNKTEDRFYFGKHGQPERFAANDVDLWNYFANLDFNFVKQGENGVANYERMAKKALTMPDFTPPAHRANGPSLHQMAKQALENIKKHKEAVYRYKNRAPWDRYARPGQPERFDASSLDRKGFAAASSSPMLGKLLSEKQMPEGGWRAVETGGGALVISFEDGDVAGNFARRVASNGYSATAPVQSIGRYWNVEVKNGK